MKRPIEVRRLTAADAERMRDIVAMLPLPEWRAERLPSLAHFGRALGDPAVYVFAAFDGERPAGFVSAYRFPAAQRLFAAAGAKGAGQRYIQFEFDMAALDGEEK